MLHSMDDKLIPYTNHDTTHVTLHCDSELHKILDAVNSCCHETFEVHMGRTLRASTNGFVYSFH